MRVFVITVFVLLVTSLTIVANATDKDPLIALAAQAADAKEWSRLGDVYLEAARLTEAKKAYQRALSFAPRDERAELGLALVEIARSDFNAAKATCKKLESKYKGASIGPICSAKFWLSNNRSARAMEELDRAVALGDVARGKTGLGEVYALRGEPEKAAQAFEEALQAGAGHSADIGLGLAREALGDKAAAVSALERAATREPGSCLAHLHLGRLLAVGPRAVDELSVALSIRPDWPPALLALGEAQLAAGDAVTAETVFRKAINSNENVGAASFGLGRALEAQGKHEEAVAALQAAIKAIPNHVGAYLLVADILYRTGKTDMAIEAMDKARNVAPGELKVYLRSGELYMRLGRHTSARSFLLQAVAMKKDLSAAHAMLGEIACARRLYDEGKSHYELAISGDLVDVDKAELEKKLAVCKPAR